MATGPINYAVGMPDLTSHFSNFNVALSGYMDRDKAIRDEAEKKAKEEAFASRLKEVLTSGDQRALLDLQIENPDKFEFARGAWDQLKDDEKKAQFGKLSEVRTALRTAPEVGIRMIRDHAAALENSGQDASQFKELLRVAELDPEAAAQSFEMLMTVADPDAVKKIYDTEGVKTKAALDAAKATREATLLPHEIAYKQAMAGKATAEASLAVPKFELEQDKLSAMKEANQLAALARQDALAARKDAATVGALSTQSQILRTMNDQDANYTKELDKLSSGITTAQNQGMMTKQRMGTLSGVLKDIVVGWEPPPPGGREGEWPPKNAITKPAKAMAGTIDSLLPTLNSSVRDLQERLQTVESQATLVALPQMSGFGTLAVAEMNTLTRSMGNLSAAQTPEAIARALDDIYAAYADVQRAIDKRLAEYENARREAIKEKNASKKSFKAMADKAGDYSGVKLPDGQAGQAQAPSLPPGRSYAKYASQPAAPAPGAAGPSWMFE